MRERQLRNLNLPTLQPVRRQLIFISSDETSEDLGYTSEISTTTTKDSQSEDESFHISVELPTTQEESSVESDNPFDVQRFLDNIFLDLAADESSFEEARLTYHNTVDNVIDLTGEDSVDLIYL